MKKLANGKKIMNVVIIAVIAFALFFIGCSKSKCHPDCECDGVCSACPCPEARKANSNANGNANLNANSNVNSKANANLNSNANVR